MKHDVSYLMERYGFTQAALAVRTGQLFVTSTMYAQWLNFDRMMSGWSR